jgi:hypothetical protein
MTAPIAHLNMRRAATAAALLVGLMFPASASAYGWPVAPFDRQHPVRGFFGDPRIGPHSRALHFGVDISAPDGTPVYATLSGRVVVEPQRPEVVAIRSHADPDVVFAYWHVVPTVRNGAHVVAYRTVIGRVAEGEGHVHFAELRRGRYLNPLRQGALAPFADATRPQVRSLTAERLDIPLDKRGLAGPVDLVADVADEMPVAAPAPWTGKPVMPALVRWRLIGRRARVALPWRTAVDARAALPSCFDAVYARWTRQNKPWSRGRYRVVLTRGLDTTALPDGHYTVEVEVADTRGNRSRRSELVVIRN